MTMTLYSRWCWVRPNIWFPPKFQFSTRIVQWCTGSLAAPKRREYRLLPCMFQFLSFIHEGSCANGEQSMRPRAQQCSVPICGIQAKMFANCAYWIVRWQLPKQSREPPTGWNERNRFVMDVSPFQHPDKCLCQCWTGEGHVWQRFDFKQRFRFWHIIPCMVCWWFFLFGSSADTVVQLFDSLVTALAGIGLRTNPEKSGLDNGGPTSKWFGNRTRCTHQTGLLKRVFAIKNIKTMKCLTDTFCLITSIDIFDAVVIPVACFCLD